MKLSEHVRQRREALKEKDKKFSLRQVAERIGMEPSYLSKLERGVPAPLSEVKLCALARELGEDSDFILAMGGKVAQDVQEIIRKRPRLFAQLIRELRNMPDDAVLRIVREVRDGEW